MDVPAYYRTLDFDALVDAYPPAPDYFDTVWKESREVIQQRQLERLRATLDRAAELPFYQRLWREADFAPGDLQSLDDLAEMPAYTIDDIRESIERDPPLGDYQRVTFADAAHTPLRVFLSGGTTGRPRPTLYTQWDREVGAILSARTFYLHGMRPGDLVMNSWAYSTHNAAWIMDHGLHHWLGCTPLTVSTGVVTSSEQQVELAHRYGVNSILATGDYLLHLADTARRMGLDPIDDFPIRSLSTFGNRGQVAEAWGCPVYDSYAFHEVQYVAAECPDGSGLHVFEDAFVVEVVDFETGEALPAGERGNLVVTALYKTGTQQVRYNIQDISAAIAPGRCSCGSEFAKIDYFQGRSDTMVKLRGVNVWPEACGEILQEEPRVTGEYFCFVERHPRTDRRPADEMTILIEPAGEPEHRDELVRDLTELLRRRLGVGLRVELVTSEQLGELTGHGTRAKLRRFEDRRSNGEYDNG